MATVTEGASIAMCVLMESAGATLGKEVIVTLSTVDATGRYTSIVFCIGYS